jgi:hypothetical protein
MARESSNMAPILVFDLPMVARYRDIKVVLSGYREDRPWTAKQ